MNHVSFIRRDCRLCGSANLEGCLELASTPLADDYRSPDMLEVPQPLLPLRLMLCRDCGFSQLEHVVPSEGIYRDYIYRTASSLGLSSHFGRYARDVAQQLALAPGGLAVDLGSNDGALLAAFKELGLRVLGCEPATAIARDATERGLETWPEFFGPDIAREIVSRKGRASVVTCNNLYANIDDLKSMTAAVLSILEQDGVFVFESFYMGSMMRNMVFDFIYHEHLSYFTIAPLKEFFAQNGMELVDVQPVSTKGGSIRCFVQPEGGKRPVSARVDEFIQAEKQDGLQTMAAFTDFAARIDSARKALADKLDTLGGPLAAYGASATTTTLAYHFDLLSRIDYFVDENEDKIGLVSPGAHIPVLAPEALLERRPEHVLVAAWRYWEPIARKNARYLREGGAFIIPLPELRIVTGADLEGLHA